MLPQAIGPFADPFGALHWIDLFAPLQQTAITRGPATTPALILPLALGAGPLPTTLAVGAGSLWISAQLLAPGAPAGGYAGLRISGGTLRFSAAATEVAGGLRVGAATKLTLTVAPDPGAPGPVGGGAPGADGGAVIADMPGSVTFVLTEAGASVTAAGDAILTAYGSTVALRWGVAAAIYEAAIGQLLIPYTAEAASFTASSVLSTLFRPGGVAPISGAAWALPVAVVPAAQLGAVASAGSLGLLLGAGLTAAWSGLASGPAQLGPAFLLGAPGVLALLGVLRGGNRLAVHVALWTEAGAPGTRRSAIDLGFPRNAPLYFTSVAQFAGASHVEILATAAALVAHLDRPLAADGGRLGPAMPGLVVTFQTPAAGGVLIGGQAPPGAAPPIALALRNALLVTTPPASLFVAGQFTASLDELNSGTLLLSFGLETLLPTLPDPYAANFLPRREREAGVAGAPSSLLLATVSWTPAATALRFTDAALTPRSLGVTPLGATPTAPPASDAARQDEDRRNALARAFNEALGSADPALLMLDVSSNVDQLGVGMAVGRSAAGTVAAAPGGLVLSLQDLDLVAPCLDLRVFTPPAVQWEPVVTIPNPNVAAFPSPVGFLDDGGPTLLGARDVTLVPVSPAPLLDRVVRAYDGGEAAAALFTLPFGMTAMASLPRRPAGPLPILPFRPGLTPIEPAFAAQTMQGGRQISLTAAHHLFNPGGRSPSLPGATVQLRNVVDAGGTPQDVSVLGPVVDTVFNTELNPGAASALVPLTRIDFSGYGASSFSAWTDPTANVPAVVHVRFNMLVGRASHEVVQVKSMLYPWGAIVVRTITIDRQDNAEVFRYDSGLVAATPGVFANMAGIVAHPGAVHGAFNIREIRDTTQVYKDAGDTVEMTAVHFDADIQIDGVVTGARGGLVPSRGQLGFVQEKPVGAPIGAADLAALIASEGALGGPVDCLIALGGTAQTMQLQRVEIGNAPHGLAAEFAAAARGSLVLPAQGNWSVLARTDGVSEPAPIDADLGIALIRQGPAGEPPPNTPWRVAEPVDLWTPDAPSMDYCLLHATDSTRMLFPRPKIDNGAPAFTATVVPLLADGFALMEATGICPRQDACLAFPNADHQLQITGPGEITLAVAPNPFPPSLLSRTLAGGAGAMRGSSSGRC